MTRQHIAHRMKGISPFHVMQLLARAKELESAGRSIIHMEVGEPDFSSPEPVITAGKNALDAGLTGYAPAAGIPQLRKAIAESYKRTYKIDIDPKRILITPGSSGALQLILGVCVNPGEAVMMADPGYPCNQNFVKMFGGIPQQVQVDRKTNYQLTAELVEKAWTAETRAVIVASPSNPTGTLLPKEELVKIHQLVQEKGGILLVDEIYQRLVYGVQSYTALDIANDLFVINSFSKYFGMTGWRVGWLVAPEEYTECIERLSQNIFISSSTSAQYAALRALDPDCEVIFEKRRLDFQERRDFLYTALKEIGFDIPVLPEGAFYLYADCSKFTNDSYSFCWNLLEAEGVAVTPGKDFGENNPQKHIRFAYTNNLDLLAEGVRRIKSFIRY